MGREYPVKKGFALSIERISEVLKPHCVNLQINGDEITCGFPGMKKIIFKISGKKLFVETETDREFKDPQETIRTFNIIIEQITGYNAKERKKLASKE
ncbi:MAG: DUF5611 family protein [Thermoplasmata archaeon]